MRTNVQRGVDLLGKIRQWIWIRTFALFISVIFNFHFQKHKILFSYQLDEFLNPQICNVKFIQMFWNKNITKMWLKWDWNRLEMSIFNPKTTIFGRKMTIFIETYCYHWRDRQSDCNIFQSSRVLYWLHLMMLNSPTNLLPKLSRDFWINLRNPGCETSP